MDDVIKLYVKDDDQFKVISVRLRSKVLDKIDTIASATNRSRNDIINTLLEHSIEIVQIESK